jgi:hypothetical protein
MKMKKLLSRIFVVLLAVFGLLLTNPPASLAQYGGAVQPGQILGEQAQNGIPAWVFALIALALTVVTLFFAFRGRIRR